MMKGNVMNAEKNPFIGVAPAIMTPFRSDGSIDFDTLLNKRQRLVQAGMEAMVWPGTMGNWSQLRPEERKEGVKLLAEQGPLIVGTGAPNTEMAADYARHAKEAGAAGLMIIPEVLYMGTVVAAQEHHFSSVLEAGGDLPSVAYNNPPAYRYSMGADQFFKLMEKHPNLKGFKESGGKEALTSAARLITHTDDCFLVVGIDNALIHGVMGCGAVGAITGVGNVLPDEVMYLWRLCQAARENGDDKAWRLAEELDRRLLPLSDYDADPRLVLYYKHLLTLLGESEYHVQRPVEAALGASEKAEAEAQLTLFQRWWANWSGKDYLAE
jgi:4-hydroxy-tetrahydrodipicolinate synthase